MIYLKWKLSDNGRWGTGPEWEIRQRGAYAEAGWAVDAAGYRIGYLYESVDLTELGTWDVTEQTEAEALTFCQQFYGDAEVGADGRIMSPPVPEPELE